MVLAICSRAAAELTDLRIGSGIGRACAIGLAREGTAGMLVADFNLESAKGVLEECRAVAMAPNFQIEVAHIDVTQVQSVQEATEVMVQQFGRIDYVVHSAGVSCCRCSSVSGGCMLIRSVPPCRLGSKRRARSTMRLSKSSTDSCGSTSTARSLYFESFRPL